MQDWERRLAIVIEQTPISVTASIQVQVIFHLIVAVTRVSKKRLKTKILWVHLYTFHLESISELEKNVPSGCRFIYTLKQDQV